MSDDRKIDEYMKSGVRLNELDDGIDRGPRLKSTSRADGTTSGRPGLLFGLLPGQGCLISVMLFILVLLAGLAVMLFSGSMTLPFT